MPLVLYDLPNWLLGVVITGSWIAIAYAGYFFFHGIYNFVFDDHEKNLSIELLAVVATINSLLLAFSAVSAWESFSAAEEAVHLEADTLNELSQDLAVFNSPESLAARDHVLAYTRLVIEDEWPAMQRGEASEEAWAAFDSIFRAIGEMEPDTPRHAALMPEIWARTNELIEHRRDRLYTADARVPPTLWLVVFVGTLLTIVTLYVLPRTAFNLTVIGLLSCSMGLVFFFIVAMDRPFAGRESISPAPFEATIQNMQRWDAETAARARARAQLQRN